MRLRRLNSTPSDTRPATSRRTTEKARRSTATATSTIASVVSESPPFSMSSTVRPTRNGISTPVPMAAAASANDATTPRR
jgi:hypothetical protein